MFIIEHTWRMEVQFLRWKREIYDRVVFTSNTRLSAVKRIYMRSNSVTYRNLRSVDRRHVCGGNIWVMVVDPVGGGGGGVFYRRFLMESLESFFFFFFHLRARKMSIILAPITVIPDTAHVRYCATFTVWDSQCRTYPLCDIQCETPTPLSRQLYDITIWYNIHLTMSNVQHSL